jgi:hypothetical protein
MLHTRPCELLGIAFRILSAPMRCTPIPWNHEAGITYVILPSRTAVRCDVAYRVGQDVRFCRLRPQSLRSQTMEAR